MAGKRTLVVSAMVALFGAGYSLGRMDVVEDAEAADVLADLQASGRRSASWFVSETGNVRRGERACRAMARSGSRSAKAAAAGPNAAGAAAGKVFAEIDAYARQAGSQPETFAGLAGTGDLVATVLASGSRRASPATRSAVRSGRPPRRSTRCRCWPRASARPASTPPCSARWPA